MNTFEPSAARARECRKAMDESLWTSSRELLEELGVADAPATGVADVAAPRPADLLDYAAYFDLALESPAQSADPAGVRERAIAHLQRRLPTAAGADMTAGPPRITNFSTDHYSPDQIEQMRRWWDIEPANRMAMIQATDEDFARGQRLIAEALGHLRDAAPEVHAEVEIVVRDIVLARPDGTNLINYAGASSFALWGALTINAETHHEWVQFYRQIVHETAHNLLFGISREQPLVLDDPSSRLPSPIRADPRPLDGIFHAAFVSAREALALDALIRRHETTGCYSEDDAQVFMDLLEIGVFAFWDCLETLRNGAQLTEHGEKILADCEAYMSANFAVEPC